MKYSHATWAAVLATVIILPLVAVPVQQSKPKGAKALFYDPGQEQPPAKSKQPKKKKKEKGKKQQAPPAPTAQPTGNVGIRYWFELEGAGKVTDNRTFRTGDRIKLHAESNADGYLTLWTKDSQGQFHQLFPEIGRKPDSNFLRAHSPYSTPGHITFNPPVDDEHLLIHFSRSSGSRPNPQDTLEDAREGASPGAEGSKALAFEREEKKPQEVGTYVVNQSGGPVMVEIQLRHRAR